MRRLLSLALLAAVSGCGSWLQSAPAPRALSAPPAAAPSPGSTAAQKTVEVSFSIKLPRASQTRAASVRPQYISGATQSASVVVTPAGGGALAPVSINCAISTSTTQGSCSGQVPAPPVSDTFTVTLYDGKNATGNVLSTGSQTQTINPGQPNSVNVTFDPVPAYVILSVNPASVPQRSPGNATLQVYFLDAQLYKIIGPGRFADALDNPISITLTSTDAPTGVSDGSTITGQTVWNAPPASEPASVSVGYGGGAITNTTFSANAPASISVQNAELTYTQQAAAAPKSLFIVDSDGNIDVYFLGLASGFPNSPSTTITAPVGTGQSIQGIAADSKDNVYYIAGSGFGMNKLSSFYTCPVTASASAPNPSLTYGLCTAASSTISGGGQLSVDGNGNAYVAYITACTAICPPGILTGAVGTFPIAAGPGSLTSLFVANTLSGTTFISGVAVDKAADTMALVEQPSTTPDLYCSLNGTPPNSASCSSVSSAVAAAQQNPAQGPGSIVALDNAKTAYFGGGSALSGTTVVEAYRCSGNPVSCSADTSPYSSIFNGVVGLAADSSTTPATLYALAPNSTNLVAFPGGGLSPNTNIWQGPMAVTAAP